MCVFDFESEDRRARLRSIHPGVTIDDVTAATGFAFHIPNPVALSSEPTDEELRVLRTVVDPLETRKLEFKQWRTEIQRRLAQAGGE
jgi:hypothetical protein